MSLSSEIPPIVNGDPHLDEIQNILSWKARVDALIHVIRNMLSSDAIFLASSLNSDKALVVEFEEAIEPVLAEFPSSIEVSFSGSGSYPKLEKDECRLILQRLKQLSGKLRNILDKISILS